MNNFNINQKDLIQIEALLKNNRNIERLYQKLYNLELEEKKDTEEYSNLLNYLSIIIEEEDKIYKESNLTIDKTLSWLKFLRHTKDKNDSSQIRITTYLFQNIIKNYTNLKNLPNKEIPNILIMSGMTLKEKNIKKEEILKHIITKEYVLKDIYYIYISFLQENINNKKLKPYYTQLLKSKYETIFLNKDIEGYALENNLNFPDEPYIISPLIKDILQIEEITYQNIKDLLCSMIIANEILNLLETNDWDYNDINKASFSITRKTMIKTCLSFMSDEKIRIEEKSFYKLLNDKEYADAFPNSKTSEVIITDAYKNSKKYKEKIKKISLK